MASPLNFLIYSTGHGTEDNAQSRETDLPGGTDTALRLDDIAPEISLFSTGLSGRFLTAEPFTHAKSFLANPHRIFPFSNGKSVYLPAVMNAFPSRDENRAVVRLYAAVQAGQWEMGTFDRPIEDDARSTWGTSYQPEGSDNLYWIRFFMGRFPRPDLAGDIFISLETLRVTAGMAQKFRGFHDHLQWFLPKVASHSMHIRHPRVLLWDLFFELFDCPTVNPQNQIFKSMAEAARPLILRGAGLKDTLSAVIAVYALLEPFARGVSRTEEMEFKDQNDIFFANLPGREPGTAGHRHQKDWGTDSGAHQTGMMDSIKNLTLIEGSIEADSGDFMTEELSSKSRTRTEKENERSRVRSTSTKGGEEKLHHGIRPLYYPEWDYLAGRYRSSWVSLYTLEMPRPEPGAGRDLLEGWEPLVMEVSRQFRMLSKEDRIWKKRLFHGDEIEFDQMVQNEIDRRRGDVPSDRIYMEKRRRVREVSTFVLVDLSASTSFKIEEGDHEGQTVLHVLLASAAVVASAIEQLRDRYCIYGFSGYGKDNVELLEIKSYREHLNSSILKGMELMRPRKSTRMGAAVRHACRVLGSEPAALKILLVLSDGFPQDHDYGDDRSSHEYGLRDTARALEEAEANGIIPFCISVDAASHDYLRRMCPPRSYAVMKRVEDLPKELPKIYIQIRNR